MKSLSWKPSVKLQSWDYKLVVAWFTDNKVVEIISGLNRWDVILVGE